MDLGLLFEMGFGIGLGMILVLILDSHTYTYLGESLQNHHALGHLNTRYYPSVYYIFYFFTFFLERKGKGNECHITTLPSD